MEIIYCDDCGVDSETDDTVVRTNCPYTEEINGVIEACTICSNCYYERCMEV